jgi:hypothetical protein
MFDEFGEVEATQTLVAAVRFFRDSPFVTGGGEIELPAGQSEQVGAMMADMAEHWTGLEGVIAGMFLFADAAQDRLQDMLHDDCEECADSVEVIASFIAVLLQYPRAVVEYVAGGLSSSEAAAARELFDELGLEAPESEEE